MLSWAVLDASAQQDPERTQFLRDIRIEAGETATEVICFNCSIFVRGQLDGDAIAIGGDIVVQGTLHGDAVALGGSIRALPNSRADADLVALGGTVRAEPGASVTGDVDSLPYFHLPGQRSYSALGACIFCAVNIGILLGLGYVIGARRTENLAGMLRRHPWMTVAAGVVVLTLYLVLIILADMLPRFGGFLIILITLAFLATSAYGYAGLAWLAGRNLARSRPRLVTWLAGSLALTALSLMPILGFAAMLCGWLLALGSATLSGFGRDSEGLAGRLIRLMRSRPQVDIGI